MTAMLITAQGLDFTVDGDGLIRREGRVVFVPGLVPGDTAEIEIIADKKNYLLGRIKKIIEPSPDRVPPACRHFGVCGGCSLQHYAYSAQLRWKENFVAQSLRRLAGLTVPLSPIVPSEAVWAYRNKAQLPFGSGGTVGFFQMNSHSVVDLQECPIQHADFWRIAEGFRRLAREKKIPIYNEKTHRGILRYLVIRRSDYLREILVGLVVNCRTFGLRPEIKRLVEEINKKLLTYKIVSVVANINQKKTNKILDEKIENILGSGFITEKIGGFLYKVSLNTFWQVNTAQAEKAYQQIKAWCDMPDVNILDAYCGVGTIALSVAERSAQVLGVEEVPQSVKDARRNAENNGVANVRFIQGKVERQSLAALGSPRLIIVDPPRRGLDPELISKILQIKPEKIIYLSCNPASLARDLKLLSVDYQVREIIPYDFFPQTTHVETLVLLQN
ncbi:23S rRNA (uracil(1939)-C(5))-methyltransferase RlmD [Candidatus Termititenax persephonae]|uniref:23S rRNA (Uracil(1939)-C(5))-methyltransferase RlmD n=1 Tax=Candidatus Termititenax persephonae TaxID=2218525 RepID=A0A388THY6_9BACT|nr:23S rRNA (uracil(1939)-C(5))-methyltransferase RlmD [Candidatus Termititenax persephonae]